MGHTIITRAHADMLVGKLHAEIRSGRKAHDLAVVYHDNVRVASFGIRRGSSKSSGHDHIPHLLHLSPHNCLLLAICDMTVDEWIERLRGLGLVA